MMNFIPRKKLNDMFHFNFHKALQKKLINNFILTNSAFSAMYFNPQRAPKNTKAQKKLWNTYDKFDENLKEFRKDNLITIKDQSYLILTTLVPKQDVESYDKKAEEPNYMLAHPGQILVQYFNENNENIFEPDLYMGRKRLGKEIEIDMLENLSINDPHLKLFTYMPNNETFDFTLTQIVV